MARVRSRLHGFREAWDDAWPDVEVAYSAVVAREGGRWRACVRRETLEDLLAGDIDGALAGAVAPGGQEEGQP